MKDKILSFDVDMTLLNDHTNSIPDSALKAIERVRENHYIVIATGRDLSQPMNQFILGEVKPDAFVHINGMKVTIEGKDVIDRKFGHELASEVIKFADEHKLGVMTLVDGIQYYSRKEVLDELKNIVVFNTEDILERDLEPIEGVNLERIYAMGLVAKDKEAQKLQAAFPQIKVTEVFHNFWYDIVVKGISKSLGMEALLKHFDKTWSDVIAFGDSMNDYEIMADAGFSVAMGNASPKVKEIADFITDNIDKDGIAKAIEKLFEKNIID